MGRLEQEGPDLRDLLDVLRRRGWILLLCLLLPFHAWAQSPAFGSDPEAAHLVTDDLARFWEAWDAAAAVGRGSS